MTEQDVARIAFLTARQAELRGLREVVFGAFIWVAIALTIWRRELGPIASMVYLVQFIVVQEFVLQFVDRRYDATYGRVNPSDGQPARGRWARTTTTQRLIAAGAALDVLTPWFPLAGVSAFSIVVAVHGLRIACRDLPWRVHHLAGVAWLALAPVVDDPSRMLSYLPAYFAGTGCLILTGLCDHLVLSRAMTRLRRQTAAPTSD